jgi:glycosyltransferase involved in cell wall biosynthesis
MRMRNEAKAFKGTRSCILFATADWDEPYWTNKQHCATTLANMGIEVIYVESIGLRRPKINSNKDMRRILQRVKKSVESYLVGPRECSKKIYVVSPLTLPGISSNAFGARINDWMLRCLIRKTIKRLGFRDVLVWAYHPFIGNCYRLPSVAKVIYHCVDDLSSVPGIDAESFRQAERRFLGVADACFVTARQLVDKCRPHNSNTHYLPNVVDMEHFSRRKEGCPVDLAAIPIPRICYHGVLSDFKIDFQLLAECARLCPDWSFILIGEEREGQKDQMVAKLRGMKNVHFMGYKSYQDMPSYLNNMDIGILPSLINSYTKSMFPMKFYEFIASGLPVVSTSLDFTRQVEGGLLTADTATEFIKMIEKQLQNGRLTEGESKRIVGDNTWRARTLRMLKVIDDVN